MNPKVICMCGSSRFVGEMAIMGWLLEKQGAIVFGLHLLPANYPGVQPDHQGEAEGVKEQMDKLHLRKIDLADEVFVFNKNGYVGNSTKREIAYAKLNGKKLTYLVEEGRRGAGTRGCEPDV